jgi:hypothetical protein
MTDGLRGILGLAVVLGVCGFYARHGCELRAAHPAYPDLPNEIQLLWYKDLRIAK